MGNSEKKPPFSLNALVEQTAQILRNIVKTTSPEKRKSGKDDGLSNKNKIHKIALLIRSEVEKRSRRKRKND